MYRFEVYLKDGKRHKVYYDLEKPSVIRMNKMEFAANDTIMEGARCVTGSEAAYEALKANGFTVTRPIKGQANYSVRLTEEMARQVSSVAEVEGMYEGAVIRQAIAFWIENGCPL